MKFPDAFLPCYFLYRLDRDVYGPICGQDWSQEWSEEVCAGMNFLGVENSWNSSLVASEYFLLNGSLTVDDVSHVQEARSNYIQPCGTDAISFQCQSYSKKAALYLSLLFASSLCATLTFSTRVPNNRTAISKWVILFTYWTFKLILKASNWLVKQLQIVLISKPYEVEISIMYVYKKL